MHTSLPSPETVLSLAMRRAADRLHPLSPNLHDYRIALDAVRVVKCARIVRRLCELQCGRELTRRQTLNMERHSALANTMLGVYGMILGNPWGLVHYALPIAHDGHTSSDAIPLA